MGPILGRAKCKLAFLWISHKLQREKKTTEEGKGSKEGNFEF
jgi:hypothetical protein